MGDDKARVDIEKLLSLGEDLIGVLSNKKDVESLMQSVEGKRGLDAVTQGGDRKVQALLEEYQKKTTVCEESIDKTRNDTVTDADIERLQHELEEKLQTESLFCQELREIHEELDDLERERGCIEQRKELVKQRKKDLLMARDLLSMCASVTNIIPNLDDQTVLSGFVVDRNKKRCSKFEIEASLPPYETSNRLWKMAGST